MERPLWRRGLQEETAVDILLIGYKHFGGIVEEQIPAFGGSLRNRAWLLDVASNL